MRDPTASPPPSLAERFVRLDAPSAPHRTGRVSPPPRPRDAPEVIHLLEKRSANSGSRPFP